MEDIIVWLRSSADEYGMGRCNEAADRIEKLEALVEQLRNDNSSMIDDYDTDFLRQEKRIEKLEAALRWYAEHCQKGGDDIEGPEGDYGERAIKALEGKDE